MIQSMTGYGKCEKTVNDKIITVEIKSVNSRYMEYSSRLPKGFAFLDDKLKKLLSESISRGKVELMLACHSITESDMTVSANIGLAKEYYDAINNIKQELGLKSSLSAEDISRYPDVLLMQKSQKNEEQLWEDIKSVAIIAIENYIKMREIEGESLVKDILQRLEFISKAVLTIDETSKDRLQKYRDKLYARLKEVLENNIIDEARILTEAAIFADKTSVDEETVRLSSHIEQYKAILSEGGVAGRKLDFLTQELNRETNTIGSKCNEISVTQLVIDMKAEIEKIREQVQNIE